MKGRRHIYIAFALLLAFAAAAMIACSSDLVTVKFFVDGKLYVTKNVTKGGSLDDVPEVPGKDGFKGSWSETNFDEINADMSVFAVYAKDTYTVSFYADNVLVKEVTEKKGKTVTSIPTVPQKEGYDAEWSITLFKGIDTDTRVDAVYTVKGTYVTFYRFAYSFVSTDVAVGEEIPVGTYYVFNGDEYVLTDDEIFASGTEYYVKQREVYQKNKVSASGIVEVPVLPSVEGRNVKWRKLVRTEDGEEFTAFVSDGITEDREVVAYEYATIELVDPIDGSVGKIDVDIDESVAEPDPITDRKEYLFYGWFMDEKGKTKATFPCVFDKNTTIYAKWIRNKKTDGLLIDKNTVTGYDGSETEIYIPHVNEDADGNRYEITEIADGAFSQNATITAVHFPVTVQNIGKEAFKNAPKLVTADFLDGCNLVAIGESAFEATKITSIQLAPETTEIGQNCFYGCAELVSVEDIEESVITEIPQNAFYGCESLEKITLPETVVKIGESAFNGAKGAKIVFEDETKIKYIGGSAFAGCAAFGGISAINVEYIGANAFGGCLAMEKITLVAGSDTDVIGENRPNALYEITFAAGNGQIKSNSLKDINTVKKITIADGVWNIEEEGLALAEEKTVTEGELTVVLPETLIKIGKNAFSGRTDLKKIVLPEGLKEIGDRAFYGLKNLAEVTTGSGAKFSSVGEYVFGGTNWFEGFGGVVTLGKTVFGVSETYCQTKNYTFVQSADMGYAERVAPKAFYGNKLLTGIELGPRIIFVGEYAFASCSSLEIFRFNTSVGLGTERKIGENALADLTALKEVAVYDDVDIKSAFGGQSSAQKVELECTGKNAVADETVLEIFEDVKELIIGDGYTRVEDGAFENAAELEKVKIGKTVIAVGNNAFKGAAKLVSLDLSECVALTTIGRNAFYGTSVAGEEGKTFVFPATTRIIDAGAFEGARLTDVELGEKLTTVGARAFANNQSLKSAVISDGTEEIGDYAFFGCGLTELTLPESVKKVGRGILVGNKSFRTLTLSGSLSVTEMFSKQENGNVIQDIPSNFGTAIILKGEIGDKQFFGVTSLQTVTVTQGVTAIGISAFEGCSSLGSVIIPSSVKIVGDRAFASCKSLTSARFDKENGVLDKMGKEIFAGDVSLAYALLPNEVKETDYTGIFDGCKALTTVNLPETVTVIGDYAYRNCESLVTPSVHDGLKEIGVSAFEGCKKIDFDDVRFDALARIGENAFKNCSSMHGIKAKNAKDIGQNAFYGATSLNEITVTGEQAISYYIDDAGNIATVNVTEDPSENIFDRCDGLKTIVFYGENGGAIKTAIENVAATVAIFVTENAYATDGLSEKTYLNPTQTTAFEYSYDKKNLTATIIGVNTTEKVVYLPTVVKKAEEGEKDEKEYTVTAVGKEAFKENATLEKIVIPAEITVIEDEAFYSCTNLSAVRFESGSRITAIGANAFNACKNLAQIVFPSSLTSIGENAFAYCEGLTSITFYANSKLVSIGASAFQNAIKLQSVALTSEIKSIGKSAFGNCSALQSFDFGKKTTITSISDGLFDGCQSLAQIEIPEGVTAIGNAAFKSCLSLKSVDIPYTVVSIGSEAFRSSGVGTVTFGRNVLSIGENAFYGCESLTEAIIPDSVTEIGGSAFANCSSLHTISIGKNVKTIGVSAFSGVQKLSVLDYYAALAEDLTSSSNIFYKAGTNADGGIHFNVYANVERIPAYLFSTSDGTYSPTLQAVYFNGISSCEEIGERAFAGVTTLKEIEIPVSLLKIGYAAFDGTSEIEVFFELAAASAGFADGWDVGLNETQVSFGQNNKTSGDYSYVERDGKAYLTKYNGDETEVTVPETVEGLQVAYVGAVFEKNETVTKIILPVNADRAGSFYGCTALTSITLPEKIAYISSNAFKDCAALDNIVIPSGVTRIGKDAFYGCDSLETVYIKGEAAAIMASEGDHESGISEKAVNYYFATGISARPDETYGRIPEEEIIAVGYNAYTKLYWTGESVGEGVTAYLTDDGKNARTYKIVIGGTGSVKDYSTATLVPWAVYAKRITEIVIGQDVASLGKNSFVGFDALTSVKYDAERGSYSSNKNIFSASASGGFTLEIGVHTKVLPSYLFYGNTSLTEISYAQGNEIEEIGACAFYGCTGLTEITIPDTVKTVGRDAFNGCTKVIEIYIGTGVSELGQSAFDGATALETLVYNAVRANDAEIGTRIFGLGTKGKAFALFVNSAVERIPAYMFYENSSLSEIAFSNKLTEIGACAFGKCTALTSVTLPTSLETIGEKAFAEATNLSEINIESGESKLKQIGANVADNTKFYNNESSWTADSGAINERGVLILANKYLIRAKSGITGEYSIPTGIKGIADEAFYNCTGLEFVRVSASVEYIGENAFSGCSKLRTVYVSSKTVASGLENENSFGGIAKYARHVYVAATLVEETKVKVGLFVRENFTAIGEKIEFAKSGDYYAYTKAAWNSGDAGMYLVNDEDNSSLYKAIIIGTGVMEDYSKNGTQWNEYASLISEITVGSGVTRIGSYAFYGCVSLKTIDLGAAEVVGEQAFYGCESLAELTVPSSIIKLENGAFGNCYALGKIDYKATSVMDLAEDNGVFANAGTASSGGATVTIDRGVEYIPSYLFYPLSDGTGMPDIRSITFRSSNNVNACKEIAPYAFAGLKNLNTVEFALGSTLSKIGDYAFDGCSSLAAVTLTAGIQTVGQFAFRDCYAVEAVIFNATEFKENAEDATAFEGTGKTNGFTLSVSAKSTVIPKFLFKGATYLKTVEFVSGGICESIGTKAFEDCSSLQAIAVPDTVTTIGEGAFSGCVSLTEYSAPFVGGRADAVEESANTVFGYVFGSEEKQGATAVQQNHGNGKETYYIPDSVTDVKITKYINIYYGAFYGCGNIRTVYLNVDNEVETIEEWVTDENGNKKVNRSVYNGAYVGAEAFYNCVSLTSINFAESLQSIGKNAFYDCVSLEEITIPENVKTIGENAFAGCKGLSAVNFNAAECADSYTEKQQSDDKKVIVSNNVFASAGENKSGITVTIGKAVKKIPAYLFAVTELNSPKIAKLTFEDGSACTSIGEYAFCEAGANSFKSIDIAESVIKIGRNAFSGTAYYLDVSKWSDGVLYIDECLIGAEKITTTDYNMITGTRIVADYAFYDVDKPEKITLAETVTHIGAYAFAEMTALKEFEIASSSKLVSIGERAFSNCGNLGTAKDDSGATIGFYVRSNVQTIGAYAFYGCIGLTTIWIDSAAISEALKANGYEVCGGILENATTVYVNVGISKVGAVLSGNRYDKSSSGDYYKYTKK